MSTPEARKEGGAVLPSLDSLKKILSLGEPLAGDMFALSAELIPNVHDGDGLPTIPPTEDDLEKLLQLVRGVRINQEAASLSLYVLELESLFASKILARLEKLPICIGVQLFSRKGMLLSTKDYNLKLARTSRSHHSAPAKDEFNAVILHANFRALSPGEQGIRLTDTDKVVTDFYAAAAAAGITRAQQLGYFDAHVPLEDLWRLPEADDFHRLVERLLRISEGISRSLTDEEITRFESNNQWVYHSTFDPQSGKLHSKNVLSDLDVAADDDE